MRRAELVGQAGQGKKNAGKYSCIERFNTRKFKEEKNVVGYVKIGYQMPGNTKFPALDKLTSKLGPDKNKDAKKTVEFLDSEKTGTEAQKNYSKKLAKAQKKKDKIKDYLNEIKLSFKTKQTEQEHNNNKFDEKQQDSIVRKNTIDTDTIRKISKDSAREEYTINEFLGGPSKQEKTCDLKLLADDIENA